MTVSAARRKPKGPALAWGGLQAHHIAYDPDTHTSKAPDGRDVPHVTAVLAATGIATDFEMLASMSEEMGVTIEEARLLGTAVHADTHAYDDGTLDWGHVHPRVLPYVEAWATFCAHKRVRPLARERRLFHPLDWWTGIMDGVFDVGGDIVLLDEKTGDPESSGARWQIAAYEAGYEWQRAADQAFAGLPKVERRWAVRLDPHLRVPYRVTDYTDEPDAWRHYAAFQAFLTTYRHQAVRRGK